MKRSSKITLRLMLGGAALATLAACDDDSDVGGKIYASEEACIADGVFTPQICEAVVAEAQSEHLLSAPRYNTRQLCEEEFGLGLCSPQTEGPANFWVPLVAGYFVAEVIDEIGDLAEKRYKSKSLYRSRSGSIVTTSGTSLRRSSGDYVLSRSTVNAPPKKSTIMTRTTVRATGGFGSRSSSRSSGFGSSRGG